jgi:hypothetical protein
VSNAQVADRLEAALRSRGGALRSWTDARLRERGAQVTP